VIIELEGEIYQRGEGNIPCSLKLKQKVNDAGARVIEISVYPSDEDLEVQIDAQELFDAAKILYTNPAK
jgi:hypothetical protein